MHQTRRMSVVSDGRILKVAFEYSELLKKLGVNLRPVDASGKVIIFVIHRNTGIGSTILLAMLKNLEHDGFHVPQDYKSYSVRNIEVAKMSPYFEKANVVLLLDHPEISHDVELYDELKNLWPKTPK